MSLFASTSRAARSLARPALGEASSSRVLLTPAFPYQSASFSSSSSISAAAAAPFPPKSAKGPKKPISSTPEGTVLTGLNILKDQPEVKALADEEYPDWLWTLLDKPVIEAKEISELKNGKDFAAQKKALRAANRANIKGSNYLKTT